MWKKSWATEQASSSRFLKRIMPLVLMGGVITIVLASAGLILRASKGRVASKPVGQQTTVVLATQHVRFTVYPEGIHPATATVRKGVIAISIEDLAGAEGGVLVERLNGSEQTTVGNVKRFQRHWRGRSLIDLSPGVYQLRVADGETRGAQLTVEP